jgi:hypothetical protein
MAIHWRSATRRSSSKGINEDCSITFGASARPCWGGINDEIVVTTTDYLPGHSEKLTINKVDGTSVTLNDKIKWPHNGVRYGGHMDRGREFTTRLPNRLQKTLAPDLLNDGAETRAAVARSRAASASCLPAMQRGKISRRRPAAIRTAPTW